MFQKNWKRWERGKEAIPNSRSRFPTISFKSSLCPEILAEIKIRSNLKIKSKFINEAIEMKYFFDRYKVKFLETLIQENFYEIRHLLRKEGSRRNKEIKK